MVGGPAGGKPGTPWPLCQQLPAQPCARPPAPAAFLQCPSDLDEELEVGGLGRFLVRDGHTQVVDVVAVGNQLLVDLQRRLHVRLRHRLPLLHHLVITEERRSGRLPHGHRRRSGLVRGGGTTRAPIANPPARSGGPPHCRPCHPSTPGTGRLRAPQAPGCRTERPVAGDTRQGIGRTGAKRHTCKKQRTAGAMRRTLGVTTPAAPRRPPVLPRATQTPPTSCSTSAFRRASMPSTRARSIPVYSRFEKGRSASRTTKGLPLM